MYLFRRTCIASSARCCLRRVEGDRGRADYSGNVIPYGQNVGEQPWSGLDRVMMPGAPPSRSVVPSLFKGLPHEGTQIRLGPVPAGKAVMDRKHRQASRTHIELNPRAHVRSPSVVDVTRYPSTKEV